MTLVFSGELGKKVHCILNKYSSCGC